MSPIIAQQVVKSGDWHIAYSHIVENLGKNPNTPLNFFNIIVLEKCLEKYKSTNPAIEKDSAFMDLYESAKTVVGGLNEILSRIESPISHQFYKVDRFINNHKIDIQKATQRFDKLMKGKRFNISQEDLDLLQKAAEHKELKYANEMAAGFSKFAKALGKIGLFIDIFEVANSLFKAFKTGDWKQFIVKAASVGSSMLVVYCLSAVAIVTAPEAILVAILAMCASMVLSDENMWEKIIESIGLYLK